MRDSRRSLALSSRHWLDIGVQIGRASLRARGCLPMGRCSGEVTPVHSAIRAGARLQNEGSRTTPYMDTVRGNQPPGRVPSSASPTPKYWLTRETSENLFRWRNCGDWCDWLLVRPRPFDFISQFRKNFNLRGFYFLVQARCH